MSDKPALDFADLLIPFADRPAGTDPRADATAQSLYYQLRDARSEARAVEREADSESSNDAAPPAQWRTVRDLAERILQERGKDLEVAAWMTEALVRHAGIAGLSAGAGLMAGLIEGFWDHGLFPRPDEDEDGFATVVAPIGGLNGGDQDGTLPQPVRKQIMFTRPDGTAVTFWQFMQAADVEGIGDAARKKARLATGVLVFAELERDVQAVGKVHFARVRDDLVAATAAWSQLTAVLEARAGTAAPSTRRVRALLDSLLQLVSRYAPAAAASPAETIPDMAEVSTALGAVSVAASRAPTREDALRDLARIAEFFRRTEPQSPLALTLDEAVRRARLTWPELLEEVVPNEEARNAMLVMLGIRPPPKAAG